MKLLEYQAKAVFEKFGVPTMRGCVVDDASRAEAEIAAAGLSYPVVVKAQVQIGGRGKAGGVQFADDAAQARAHCEKLLGSELRGYPVRKLLIVEKAEHQIEWYLSIMLDRLSKCPMIIFSPCGGVEIEQTAKTNPEKIIKTVIDPMIGVQDYTARYLLGAAGLSADYQKPMLMLLKNLYKAFISYDALLCEINPLVVDEQGGLTALDGKVDIDDSALYRLPDVAAWRDEMPEEALVVEARAFNFLYIPVEKGGTVGVISNGSGMLMSCIDMITKEGLQTCAGLDLGGGATAERIAEALRIMFATPGIKAALINIFGGITRCDEVAGGVKLALGKYGLSDRLIIIRMEGTNKLEGVRIVQALAGDVVLTDGLRESMAALSERRERL